MEARSKGPVWSPESTGRFCIFLRERVNSIHKWEVPEHPVIAAMERWGECRYGRRRRLGGRVADERLISPYRGERIATASVRTGLAMTEEDGGRVGAAIGRPLPGTIMRACSGRAMLAPTGRMEFGQVTIPGVAERSESSNKMLAGGKHTATSKERQ